jgi:DNA-binding winged helix-turn-helix (wHTH) protein
MFQFQGYTLDIARNVLRTADCEVALRPKSFELLRYLLENPDRLVTREELLKTIWPNVTVTDQALAHCVSEVREAIGDTDQAIIKTIPRRGYRFAAPVVHFAVSDGAAPRPPYAPPSSVVGEARGVGVWAYDPTAPHSLPPTFDHSPQRGGERARVGSNSHFGILRL